MTSLATRHPGSARWRRWLLALMVPLLATTVAARQHVLQHTDDLSIWEGGGMGMFAAIGGFARLLNIYAVRAGDPTARHPIVTLTPEQERLAGFLRKHPTEANFARLADALQGTHWVAREARAPRLVHDASGTQVSSGAPAQYLLEPAGALAAGVPALTIEAGAGGPWQLVIEFWKIRYDPASRLATRALAMRFEAP